jgi:hypothetical protein
MDKLGTGDMRVLGNGTGVHITERFHVRGALLTAPDKPLQDLEAPIDRRFPPCRVPWDRRNGRAWSARETRQQSRQSAAAQVGRRQSQ